MCRFFFIILSCAVVAIRAAQVVHATHWSSLLQKSIAYTVVLPDAYSSQIASGKRFPVLYWLHCAGCDQRTWLEQDYGNVDQFIDSVNFIAAAPFGGLSWWLDSPKLPQSAYSRFLVEEFKPLIDSIYATLTTPSYTGVAGWSMGGFGALHNLIKHPEVFGAAFSIKGGFDLTLPLNPNWGGDFGLYAVLGSTPGDTANWNAVNILKNAWRLKGRHAAIGFYSGRNDAWFAEENRRLDTILTNLQIKHLFYETDETHYTVPDKQMRRVMLFFDSVFTQAAAALSSSPGGVDKKHPLPTRKRNAADISGRRIRPAERSAMRFMFAPSATTTRGHIVIGQ